MKNKKILVVCIVLVLVAYTMTELAQNRVGVASASSCEGVASLVTNSRAISQLVLAQRLSPAYLLLPQPDWQRLDFPVLPSPRIGSSLTLNPINKIALLFGGINSTTGELNDLWITDGHSWMQFQTPHSPEPRSDASMAYDEVHQMAVLFGGIGNGELLGDTWLFNGVDWIQQQPLVSPSPRTGASMAYDSERNVNILFGGLADIGGKFDEALNEMWIWDGETWQQQFPATLPSARWGANMVYDRVRKSVILFGGSSGGGFLEDTWLWDGVTWVEQHPLHHPAGRANFGMAYDEGRQQVILFGGQTYLDVDPSETWAWDGQDWTQLPTRQAPPKELAYSAQLVYLPDLQTVTLYNALREKTIVSDESFTNTDRSEVWVLTYRNLVYLPIISRQ
ncbi:MAG: hypothetical protein JRJ29_17795 [Deltaproteobacteria bacterium]|nr:hypothetical protein [Deltaproteobacteria bacterium]